MIKMIYLKQSERKKYLSDPQWAQVQAYQEPKPPDSCSAAAALGFQMHHSCKYRTLVVQIN